MEATAKELPNLADFKDLIHIPYLLIAILLVDVVTIFLARYFPDKVGGESLNDWYDTFGLEGVIADVFIILIGFILAQYIYTIYVAPSQGWNPLLFVSVVVAVQLLHDLGFYQGVIKQIPTGINGMIDTYKKYAAENGALILLGDSAMMIGAACLTLGLEILPPYAAVAIGVLGIYTLPYILNTKRQGEYRYIAEKTVVPVKQVEKEAPMKKAPIDVPKRQSTPWDMLKPEVQSNTPDQVDTKSFMQGAREAIAFESNSAYSSYSPI
jgi:hypothetical protein